MIFCEEEERTSKKASVLGTASAVRFLANRFPDVFSGSSVLNPSKICHKDNRIAVFL